MFGKRKKKEEVPPASAVPVAGDQRPSGSSTLSTVIVPRSALARATSGETPYDLVQAVVNFVNAMTGDGLYNRFEISQQAMQAYHGDFYLAQVNNGGHSQFIHNCFANLPFVVNDVRAALTGMNAAAYLPIFERMAAWVAQNPSEAKKQTGFEGGRAPELDELDTLFYGAEKETPLIGLSARWIATWPELRAVDDSDYQEAIRRAIMLNPAREARLLSRSVKTLATQMIDWFQVGVGLACANGPEIELKLGIGGGSMMDVEGEQQLTFLVRTNAAQRFCVVSEKHAAAYECVEANNPPMPDLRDLDGMKQAIADGRLAQYKRPTVGRKLAHIKRETIAGVIELATDYAAPVALDLLLRKAGIDPEGATVAPHTIEPRSGGAVVNWLVAAGGQPLVAMTFANGSALMRVNMNEPLATVRKAEVDEHARRIADGLDNPS